MASLGGRPNRWVLEPLWIAGFWALPFAAVLLIVSFVIASPSQDPDLDLFAISIAFLAAFVGLRIRGAVRRPPQPR